MADSCLFLSRHGWAKIELPSLSLICTKCAAHVRDLQIYRKCLSLQFRLRVVFEPMFNWVRRLFKHVRVPLGLPHGFVLVTWRLGEINEILTKRLGEGRVAGTYKEGVMEKVVGRGVREHHILSLIPRDSHVIKYRVIPIRGRQRGEGLGDGRGDWTPP
ncbi:hypothetical protein J6590_067529 [Homalodisca vitripennis]|nr:hypothetical protein J6590_067529 [Homalodisca vitripennis]